MIHVRTIQETMTHELVIKNSRFICLLFRLQSLEDVGIYLEQTKREYPKATHYCYAYLFQDMKKASDDKEPAKTAGMPILNVLEKENMMDILCVVVRYYGGIKLGTGGLIRAYSKSVTDCIKCALLYELEDAYLIEIRTDYSHQKELDYFLREQEIVSKKFHNQLVYQVKISSSFLPTLENSPYFFSFLKNTSIEKRID